MNKRSYRMHTLLLVLVFVSIQTVFAQTYSQQKMDRIKKMYDVAMNSDVPGLVESGIYQVILMKHFYPEQNFSDLIETIDQLSLDGKTLQIRYKAQLASIYLKNSAEFSDIRLESVPDPVPFFKLLSARVEELAFVSASL